jgi:circadian clock protein KaiB
MTDTDQLPNYDDFNEPSVFLLKLYVTGASSNSTRAVSNLKTLCEAHLKDNYELEIIDVHQQPLMAESEQIIALPLLIKKSPGPERRLIGDMSNTDRVLKGLGLLHD